jgi:hypothetical protein
MTHIAVTGHVDVDDDIARWVVDALTERLQRVLAPGLHGITCLAKGADQLFAQVVLALNGTLDVVLPARDYARVVTQAGAGDSFHALLSQAESVRTMPFDVSDRTAYLAASEAMLDQCDLLLAVWNGQPSRNTGDTADVVAKALERQLPVEVIWPATPAAAPGPG